MDTYSFFWITHGIPHDLNPPQVNPLTPSNFHHSQISVKRLGCRRRAKAMKLSLGGCISFEVLMIGTPQKRRSLVKSQSQNIGHFRNFRSFWGLPYHRFLRLLSSTNPFYLFLNESHNIKTRVNFQFLEISEWSI